MTSFTPAPKPERTPSQRKRTRIKKQARSTPEFARVYHSVARVQFVAQLPCVIGVFCDRAGPRIGHHILGAGTSRKSGYANIIPLCRRHHDELHQHGKREFARRWGIDYAVEAADIERRWLAHTGDKP